MKKFFSDWQEPFAWFPFLFIGAWLCLKGIPMLDHTAGVDGLGYFSSLIVASSQVAFVFFWSWLYHRTYGATDDQIRTENANYVANKFPLAFYIAEKLHRLVIVIIVLICFKW